MQPEEMRQIRELISEINQETSLDREQIHRVHRALQTLLKAYKGATDRLFRLRERLRRREDSDGKDY